MKKVEKLKHMNESNKFKIVKEASAFKKFISRGNVVDMAVGVIVGGAFSKIVTSLVNDVIMPIIGVLLGGLNFSDLSIKVGEASVLYGNFIQSIIDFLIISFSIFVTIRLFEKLKKHEEKEEGVSSDTEIQILKEIRDILKDNR